MAEDFKSDLKKATISEHLIELRSRLLICLIIFVLSFCICYYFSREIYDFLVKPLSVAYKGKTGLKLIYTNLTEAFFTYMKVSFYAASFLTFPIFILQIYIFLAPGLYKKEKKILLPFLVISPILFIAGAALVYYIIFPVAWEFFLSFEINSPSSDIILKLEAKISEYLSLVTQLVFAFGIAFQLPILLVILSKIGLVSSKSLAKKRRYAIVIIVAVAAMLTPPDILSQIGLAVPVMVLYELSILLCKYFENKKT